VGSDRTGWDDPSTMLPYIDTYAKLIP
jgi:hypothetical protein